MPPKLLLWALWVFTYVSKNLLLIIFYTQREFFLAHSHLERVAFYAGMAFVESAWVILTFLLYYPLIEVVLNG